MRQRIRCVNFGRRCVRRFRLQWIDYFPGCLDTNGIMMVQMAGDVKMATFGFAWGSSFRSSFISLGLNVEFTLELAAGRTTFRRTTPTCATSSSISWLVLVCRRPSRLLPNTPQTRADACSFVRPASLASEMLVLVLSEPEGSTATLARSTCSTYRLPRDCFVLRHNILACFGAGSPRKLSKMSSFYNIVSLG